MATNAARWLSTGTLRDNRVNLKRLLNTRVDWMADPSQSRTLCIIRWGRYNS